MSSSIIWLTSTELPLKLDETIQEAAQSMERDLSMGMSFWAVVAIVCNSVVGVLILILFVILYKACKVPSHQDKLLMFEARLEPKEAEQKYILTTA